MDFIESRFKGKDVEADVIVHEHCGEAGAIGAGLEAGRLWDNGRKSTFIGLDACAHIQYKTTREEATRCYFCKNKCLRTFIDVKTNIINIDYTAAKKTKVPLEAGAQRLIIATCEKGTVENIEEMRNIKGDLDKVKKANPNFVEVAAKGVFRVPDVPLVADPLPKFQITAAQKKRAALMKKRSEIRIGMPRVLNMYSQTPIFTGYFARWASRRRTSFIPITPARNCTRKAPSAAPSTPASPRSSAFRTCTTCSTRCTPRSRSTSSSSR